MDGMKVVRLPQDRPRQTRVPQDRAHQQRNRPREPDYPRKSSLPGIPGIAWPARDPPPQRSASSDAPANQIARIPHRGVFTQPGSIMDLIVEIPDDVAGRLKAAGGDLSRRALEALALEEYK